jgi:serine phosphatase RsbU (regulator of sigma subunit)
MVESRRTEASKDVRGTQLGLMPNASYDRTIVRPAPGDLIVLSSDGFSEATNPAGKELGRDDLRTLARTLNRESATASRARVLASTSREHRAAVHSLEQPAHKRGV